MKDKIEALEYVKERYNEEYARCNHLESKCAILLTCLSAMLVFFGMFVGINNKEMFYLVDPQDFIQCAFFVLSMLSMVCSWGHFLAALRVKSSPVAPKSLEATEYLKAQTRDDALEFIYDSYAQTIPKMISSTSDKVRFIMLGYSELAFSGWFVAGFAVTKLILEIEL